MQISEKNNVFICLAQSNFKFNFVWAYIWCEFYRNVLSWFKLEDNFKLELWTN